MQAKCERPIGWSLGTSDGPPRQRDAMTIPFGMTSGHDQWSGMAFTSFATTFSPLGPYNWMVFWTIKCERPNHGPLDHLAFTCNVHDACPMHDYLMPIGMTRGHDHWSWVSMFGHTSMDMHDHCMLMHYPLGRSIVVTTFPDGPLVVPTSPIGTLRS